MIYAQPSWLTTPYLLPFVYQKFRLGEKTDSGGASHYTFDAIAQGRTYYSTGMDDDFQFSYFSTEINNKDWFEEDHKKLYSSPKFKINENKQLVLYNFFNDEVIKVFEQDNYYQLTVGKLLPFWSGVVSKQDNGSFVYNFNNNQSNAFFRDSHYSYWTEQITINTNNNENVINNQYVNIYRDGNIQNIDLPIQNGLVQTEISFDGYFIEGKQSHISTHLTFDLNKDKYSPPVIRDLQITSFNELTHQLQCGKGAISINLNENISDINFQLSIKSSDESEWLQQEIVKQGSSLIVELSDVLAGLYDLKFTATNSGENTLSYAAEPAFHVMEYTSTADDDDCDGISNSEDAFPLDLNESLDTDNDGIGNNTDADDDGDNVNDEDDAFPLDLNESLDTDNDGIGNNADADDDGDNVNDEDDAFPLDANESVDTDGDGIGNNADTDDDGDTVLDFNDAFPGGFTTNTYANSFDQRGLSGQNDLLTSAIYNGLSNPANTYSQIQSLLEGTTLATTGSLRDNQEFQEGAFREISEDTAAVYLSAYLDFDDISAIVGGRYIQTDLESSVYLNGDKIKGTNDYNDFLPSLNVTYSLNDDTLVRFASAKVMRRADFSELSPAFDVNNDITKATQGSIGLDPYRATQFDLSVEHYFGEGNMVSFAIFYKDVESFLSSEQTCIADSSTSGQNVTEWYAVCNLDSAGVDNLNMEYHTNSDDAAGFAQVEGLRDAGLTGIDTTKDTNGESGKVQGFEIGYQQHFDFLPGIWSGLGISANYTYSDSEQPKVEGEDIRPLLEISKNTYNIQGFWEYSDYAVRLAYNYRDGYLATEDEKRVLNFSDNYRADRGQLDVSASWNINEHFTVVANATNLTGEASAFENEYGSAWKYTEADRRYTVGVRAKF